MDLAEHVDPEEWHGIMDRCFRILADGVHRFEGTVNKYRGDGIMALFGAPIAHENHARRACLRGALPARRAQTRKRGGCALSDPRVGKVVGVGGSISERRV
jgi:class 3 adenylate cyclase